MATSVRMSSEFAEKLARLAARTGRSKAYHLRRILESGIAEMEEYYRAADTLERVRSGREKVYTSAELRRDLGLDN